MTKEELNVQRALGTVRANRTYKEFVEEYIPTRDWTDKDVMLSIEDGWYDWFCSDHALPGRLRRLLPAIQRIMKSPKISPDETFLIFKNSCPVLGGLYDEVFICDIVTGDTLYAIVPDKSAVWSNSSDFQEPPTEGNIYTFFGV